MTIDERVEKIVAPWLSNFQEHQRNLLRVLVRKALELGEVTDKQLQELGEYEGRRGRT